MNKWLKSIVIEGDKIGRTIGFPTLNLDKPNLLKNYNEGVYIVRVKINKASYYGLLFFGPRIVLGETQKILEIYVFDFDEEVYGKKVSFQIISFLRPVINFTNLESLKKQIDKDCAKAKEILSTSSK